MVQQLQPGWLRSILSFILWPLILGGGLFGAGLAFASDHPLLWFNVVYLSVALVIGIFERLVPHEESWLEPDHETVDNLLHALLSKGSAVLGVAVFANFTVVTAMFVEAAFSVRGSLWPSHWPLAAQVILAVLVAELGLYIAHRVAHERLFFWRFHALHHSPQRLWVVNSGRFHLADALLKASLSQIPLYLLGAPLPVFLWFSAITATNGLLSHANIDLRTGPFDLMFCTPTVHRWHHSKIRSESNRNYGENIMLWDLIFATYINPARRSPAALGIRGQIAKGFVRQFIQPFSRSGVQSLMGKAPIAPAAAVSLENPDQKEGNRAENPALSRKLAI